MVVGSVNHNLCLNVFTCFVLLSYQHIHYFLFFVSYYKWKVQLEFMGLPTEIIADEFEKNSYTHLKMFESLTDEDLLKCQMEPRQIKIFRKYYVTLLVLFVVVLAFLCQRFFPLRHSRRNIHIEFTNNNCMLY